MKNNEIVGEKEEGGKWREERVERFLNAHRSECEFTTTNFCPPLYCIFLTFKAFVFSSGVRKKVEMYKKKVVVTIGIFNFH